jgi:hypothetical protein
MAAKAVQINTAAVFAPAVRVELATALCGTLSQFHMFNPSFSHEHNCGNSNQQHQPSTSTSEHKPLFLFRHAATK